MARGQRKGKVGTLGEIKRSHHNLYFHCARLACWRGSKAPLDDLIAKYGAAVESVVNLPRH